MWSGLNDYSRSAKAVTRAKVAVAAVALLAGCAHPASVIADSTGRSATAPIAAPQELNRLIPIVDHHQHLLSPVAVAQDRQRLSPEIEVPADIAQLLQRRAEFSASAAALTDIFTRNALFLDSGREGWMRGGDKAANHISTYFRPGYRLTPVSYTTLGNAVEIAGYYTRGEGATLRHPGYFRMSLLRGTDGSWRIASETPIFPGPTVSQPIDGDALVRMLDEAGIERAIVLSNATWFDGVIAPAGDQHQMVRTENDWTAEQVTRFPDRLFAFCSFNPLADHALAELEHCSTKSEFRGLKLHFGNSGVDLLNPEHTEKVRRVFVAANRLGFPILAHLAASPAYGRRHSEIFLNQLVPTASDVPVIIAHLWGGAGYVDEALGVYADAISAGHPVTRNLYFDVAQISLVEGNNDANLQKMAARMRQIGFDRLLYGSDGAIGSGQPPERVWADFRVKMPLTDEEFRIIARNVLPGFR